MARVRAEGLGIDQSGDGRMAEKTERSAPPTLAAEARALTDARIVEATCGLLASRGFDTTIDDVAAAASVSRRTVFRHFPTMGQLFGAAAGEIARIYERSVPAQPPPGADLDSWLREVAIGLHHVNREVVGEAFWGIHRRAPRWQGESPGGSIAAVVQRIRGAVAQPVSVAAWRMAGGAGDLPGWVADSLYLLLSGFATNGLATPPPRSPEETGDIAARAMAAVIRSAVAAQAGRTGQCAPYPAGRPRSAAGRSQGGGRLSASAAVTERARGIEGSDHARGPGG